MCRIFVEIGMLDKKEVLKSLRYFRSLADCGCTPQGSTSGHRDGWGIVAYKKNKLNFCIHKNKDASADPSYVGAVNKLSSIQPGLVMAHFRKASIGGKILANVHPFIQDNYSFCHNGSIFDSKKIKTIGSFLV